MPVSNFRKSWRAACSAANQSKSFCCTGIGWKRSILTNCLLLRRRGYRFITLEDALSDDAYGLPNTWVGEEGRGWIEQWAITKGQMPQGEPVFPKSIEERIKALPRPPAQP